MSFKWCNREIACETCSPEACPEQNPVENFKERLRAEMRKHHKIARQISDLLERVRAQRSDVAVLIEHRGRCMAMSPGAADVLGIPEEELIGQRLRNLSRLGAGSESSCLLSCSKMAAPALVKPPA